MPDRPYPVRKKEFDDACERMRSLAAATDGKFEMTNGISQDEIDGYSSPMIDKFVKKFSPVTFEEREKLKAYLDAAYLNACVSWLHQSFAIGLSVQFNTTSVGSDSQPDYNFRSVITPKSTISLSMTTGKIGQNLHLGKFGGESIAGKPFTGWMKFMSPKAVTTMFERMPEERFYCPLSDSEAAKRYVVRGYPVALVNAFAMNSEVNEIARGLTKFLDLNVGFSDLASGGKSDAVTMKMAIDANVSELQAGFDLVCRTLEVLCGRWL